MHAVMLQVKVDPARFEESVGFVEREVLPVARQMPGIVAGYWLASPQGDGGIALTVFETEDAAKASMEMMDSGPRPDYARFHSIELLRVTASL
jgi:hypothetical protein